MNLFRSKDFLKIYVVPGVTDNAEALANIANQIFNKWLGDQTVVYGIPKCVWGEPPGGSGFKEVEFNREPSTHKARLVYIEEIKKCEHDEIERVRGPHGYGYQCTSCEKELNLVEG